MRLSGWILYAIGDAGFCQYENFKILTILTKKGRKRVAMQTERHEPTTGGLKKISNFFKGNNFLGLNFYRFFMKKYFILVFFLFAAELVFAQKKMDEVDKEIANARSKTGDIITCSPKGKIPGTITVEDALEKLQPGMVLRLLPGYYNLPDVVLIEKDNVIVEGDNSGNLVNLPLYLYGKNCIVRGIKIRSIEADRSIIIDTVAFRITILSGRINGRSIIANCATNSLTLYNNAQEITVRNTSIVNGSKTSDDREAKVIQTRTYTTHASGYIYNIINFGNMEKKGKISFENCLFFSEGHLFNGNHPSMKLINLTLRDNLIWCKRSLFSVSLKNTDLKTIGKLASFFDLENDSKNLFERPKMKQEPGGWWDIRPATFIVSKGNGSNKEYGCNMSESMGIPLPQEN